MIPIKDIEEVYAILDREVSFIESTHNLTEPTKAKRIAKWEFVRESFRKVCMSACKAEGIFKE
jgi:hypothetical protein